MRTHCLFAAGLALFAGGATAGADEPAIDPATALGQCMTLKSTGEDRLALARWVLTSLGSAPQVRSVVSVLPEAKEQQDRAVAALFTRLITVDCLAEAQVVARTSGATGFRLAGQSLGRLALQELLGDPIANDALGAFAKYVKEEDFAKLRPPAP